MPGRSDKGTSRPGHSGQPENHRFLEVLSQAVEALEQDDLEYLLMGGVSSATLGRPRFTHDIDLFIRPEDATAALEALTHAGFDPERTDARWLYKAFKDKVMVDLIFRSAGDIYLDAEMLEHASVEEVGGRLTRVIAPEDLVLIKAVVAAEHAPRHWYDALGLIARCELDWDYLVRRARRHGIRRVLSLLVYAQSDDLGVPPSAIQELYQSLFQA